MKRKRASIRTTRLRTARAGGRALLALALALLPALAGAETALADLVIDGRPRGGISLELDSKGDLLVPVSVLTESLSGFVKPEILDRLATSASPLGFAELAKSGITAAFDRGTLTLTLSPAPEARVLSLASVLPSAPVQHAGESLENAPLSLILGTRMSLFPAIGLGQGARPFSLDAGLGLSPAFRVFGLVLEADTSLDYTDSRLSWSVSGAKAVLDFRKASTRLTAGMVSSSPVVFQSGLELWGLTLGSEGSLARESSANRSPYSPRRAGDFGADLVLDRDAWITLIVNGVTTRRFRLNAGAYRLSDLPLATGLNEVSLRIEEEGAAPRTMSLGQPFDPSLLAPGALDWAFSVGLPGSGSFGTSLGPALASDQGATANDSLAGSLGASFLGTSPLASARLAFGAAANLQLGMNLEAGNGLVLAGFGLLSATALGNFGLDGGFSLGYGGEPASPAWAARGSWRLTNEARPFLPRLGAVLEYRSPGFSAPTNTGKGENLAVGASVASASSDAGDGSLSVSAQAGERLPGRGGNLALIGNAVFSGSGSLDLRSWSATLALGLPAGAASSLSLSAGLDWKPSTGLAPRASFTLTANGDGKSTITWTENYSGGSESGNLALALGGGSAGSTVLNLSEQGLLDASSPASLEAGVTGSGRAASLSAGLAYNLGRFGAASSLSGNFGLSSSLVLADGQIVATNSPGQALAILAPDRSLAGKQLSLSTSRGATASSPRGHSVAVEGLVPYRPDIATLDLPGDPSIVKLSPSSVELSPAYRSVAVIHAGARASVAIRATVVDASGKPLALLAGDRVSLSGAALPDTATFTDEKGVFEAYDLDPGPATIRFQDGSIVTMTLPQGLSGKLVDLGVLVATPAMSGGRP